MWVGENLIRFRKWLQRRPTRAIWLALSFGVVDINYMTRRRFKKLTNSTFDSLLVAIHKAQTTGSATVIVSHSDIEVAHNQCRGAGVLVEATAVPHGHELVLTSTRSQLGGLNLSVLKNLDPFEDEIPGEYLGRQYTGSKRKTK